MDEHRIEDALRAGPPDEPAYVPGLGALPATEQQPTEATFGSRIRRPDRRITLRARASGLRFVTCLAAVLAIVVVGVALRFDTGPAATQTPGDLLARIKAAGAVRIAVSTEAPQTAVGGAFIGFDVDVAKALAAKLGVRAELQFLTPDEIFSPTGTWDIALPSHVIPDRPIAAVSGASYYDWPEWVVVASASATRGMADLDGRPVCVVAGSPGADWLTSHPVAYTRFLLDPPQGVTAIERSSDADCFAAVAAGDADAAVTATLLDSDVASRDMRLLVADPAIVQHRGMLIRDGGPLASPATLEAALETAVAELRSNGQLADLSRRAFGGQDLTKVTE
jgi:L-cystine transport system substrate-binding protein